MPCKLNAESIRELRAGQTIKCHVVLGLQLKGLPSGRGSWMLYYRSADGTQRRPKLGDYPSVPLAKARQIAQDWLARVAKGDDPSEARKAVRDAPTVSNAISEYLRASAGHLKPRSLAETQRNLVKHVLPAIGGKRVADLMRSDIAVLHKRLTADAGPVAANRTINSLSAVLSMCEADDYSWRPRGSNPCREVPRNRELLRRVHVTEDQFRAVALALDTLADRYPRHVAAIYIALYAGTRITELVTAPRDALRGAMLILDEHKTDRTGEPRIIHLPTQAVDMLRALPDDGSGMLFGRLDRFGVRGVWERAREQAGVPHVRLQDMRRTFASIALSRVGASLAGVGRLLGHADAKTTMRYAWLTDAAGRDLTQQTADEISALMRPVDKD